MAELGAAAHRLNGGGVMCIFAEAELQQSFDEFRAQEPQEGEASDGQHVVEPGSGLFRIVPCGGDLALAHAVAAADLCVIREGCNGPRRVVSP